MTEQGATGSVEDGVVRIRGISAVTLATHDMARAVRFYRALGFALRYGGETADFTSFLLDGGYLNLTAQPPERRWQWWGRVIFYVSDVDALYRRALAAELQPQTQPRDAEWANASSISSIPTATN